MTQRLIMGQIRMIKNNIIEVVSTNSFNSKKNHTTTTMLISAVILVILQNIFGSNGANILAVVPSPSYSHQIVFHPIWKELSLRGHQVTTITTDPIKDPKLTNLTEIDLHYIYDEWNEMKSQMFEELKRSNWKLFLLLFRLMTNISDTLLHNPEVQILIKNKKQNFDLVFVEVGSPILFAFGERFNCPVIAVISLDGTNPLHDQMGNPTHPVLYPSAGFPFIAKLNFMERLISCIFNLFNDVFYQYTKPEMQAVVNLHFGNNSSNLDIILERIDMAFINTDSILHPIRPLVPSVVQIGTGIHLQPPKALPKDIQKYLDDASEGVIYFSLGSNAQSKDLTEKVLQVILQSFSKLPYKVLWKFEDQLSGKPDNIMITKWAPQQDVLRHPNIKLFISQCGLQSTEESLYSEVPMLGMPMFGDQEANAKLIEQKGIGLSVNYKTMTEEEFSSKILEIIENRRYTARVKELASLAKDQPMTGLEKALWWSEYVLRHKGAKHLRSPALDLPAHQYYFLDIIGFCAILIVIIVFVSVKTIGLVCKKLTYLFNNTNKVKVT